MDRSIWFVAMALSLVTGFLVPACYEESDENDPPEGDSWVFDGGGEDTAIDTGGEPEDTREAEPDTAAEDTAPVDTGGGTEDTEAAEDTGGVQDSGGPEDTEPPPEDTQVATDPSPDSTTDTGGSGVDISVGPNTCPFAKPTLRNATANANSSGTCFNCVDPTYYSGDPVDCSGGSALPRCTKQPAGTSWGPASVITRFEVTSPAAKSCCFNLDGSQDGSIDNGFATLASFLPGADLDRRIKKAMVDGDFALVAEHQGLSSLNPSGQFTMNFMFAGCSSAANSGFVTKQDSNCNFGQSDCAVTAKHGSRLKVDADSFAGGTQALSRVDPSSIASSTLDAGPGIVLLNMSLFGIGETALPLYGATIEGTVDTQASQLQGDGVVVDDGKIGGYILIKDVIWALDRRLSDCNCLGNPSTAIDVPSTSTSEPDLKPDGCYDGSLSGSQCEIECTQTVDSKTSNCGSNAPEICANAGTLCSSIGLLTDTADLDVDGDGNKDALSFGALFEMKGARIVGVSN